MSHTGAAELQTKTAKKLGGKNCSGTLKRSSKAGNWLCCFFPAALALGVFLDNHLILHMDLCLLSNDQNNWGC